MSVYAQHDGDGDRRKSLGRSRAEAERGLADPSFRAYLEESTGRIDAKRPPAPLLTREEFLAWAGDRGE